MKNIEISKELFEFIYLKCKAFKNKTNYDVSVEDVLFSYLHSTDKVFHVLYDWDEGKNNDPFWNEEKDEHCVIVFLKEMCVELNNKTYAISSGNN